MNPSAQRALKAIMATFNSAVKNLTPEEFGDVLDEIECEVESHRDALKDEASNESSR
jgi:hypothetical protein